MKPKFNSFKKTATLLFITIPFTLCSPFDGHTQTTTFKSEIEKVSPFPVTAVKLKPSWIKQREELNTIFLKSLDPDRLLHNFRINAGLQSNALPLEGWEAPQIGLRGHFTGHYLSAASYLIEAYQDTLLLNRINYMIDELYKCQQALKNGYLSAFPESDFDILESQFGGVWAPYYTYNKIMQGILDVYIHTKNPKAYEIVTGMADYVALRMSRLDEETIEKVLYSVDANPTNEAGAMNEVLYKLYKVSGDTKHLTLAKIFDRDWFVTPLAENRDILSGLHSNTHLVLVNGFAQRYSITGESKFHNATVNFWNMLMNQHAYANGSSSGPRPIVTTPTSLSAEHWGNPGILSNTLTKETSESCVSHNTQKLTASLFSWTGDPIYADAYMNTFYNAVLALQNNQNGTCVYHLPLGSPQKKLFLKENDFRCCNGSSCEAFTALNTSIYYHHNSDLWVNLYIPSDLTWEEMGVTLEQNGNFPSDSSTELTVTSSTKKPFTIHLFIPSWAKNTEIYINDEKQTDDVSPLSYFSLNRKWRKGDKIKMIFHYDFHIKTMPDNENVIALFYGPTMLAFETSKELILKGSHQEILRNIVPRQDGTFLLSNNKTDYVLKPLYDINSESYGVYATIRNY